MGYLWISNIAQKSKCQHICFVLINIYLHKDDHVPDCFDQNDVRATLAQLLVFWETDFKQISCVLQLLHFCLHHRYCSIRLETETFFKMLWLKIVLFVRLYLITHSKLVTMSPSAHLIN